MRIKQNIFYLIIGLIVLVAIYIGLYPTISNYYWQSKQTQTIESYNDALKANTQNDIINARNQAIQYNEKLYETYKNKLFTYQGANKTDDEYESILNVSNIMGYIEIPKIDVYLPITHGTKSADLDSMVGHLYQSSIPIGGNNTHAILSAHTGLAQARLFTDLDKLKINDKFYIYVLDRKLCYKVIDINVCTPEEDYHYMQIEPNKDLISLYTCTPYGINDHRLIVKGEHITSEDEILEIPKDNVEVQNLNKTSIILFYLFILIPIILYIIYAIILCAKQPKNDKK